MRLENKFETEHLRIRKAEEKDLDSIFNNVWKDETLFENLFMEPTLDYGEAKERLNRTIAFQKENRFAFFVCLKESDEAIGFVFLEEPLADVKKEATICIGKDYQNKGYGKELVAFLLEFSFNRLIADVFIYSICVGNEKSKALIKPYPFHKFSTVHYERDHDKKVFEVEKYAITRQEYRDYMKNKND